MLGFVVQLRIIQYDVILVQTVNFISVIEIEMTEQLTIIREYKWAKMIVQNLPHTMVTNNIHNNIYLFATEWKVLVAYCF